MNRSRGFSLLELLTVLAIIGVFVAIGLPSFTYLSRTTQVKTASSNIYLALLKARSEAVKRNSNVTITPTHSDFAQGWTMTDFNGALLSTQEELKGVRVSSSITTSLTYLASGRISGGVVPTFSVQQPSTDSQVFAARCISVSPNGAPYVKSTAC